MPSLGGLHLVWPLSDMATWGHLALMSQSGLKAPFLPVGHFPKYRAPSSKSGTCATVANRWLLLRPGTG